MKLREAYGLIGRRGRRSDLPRGLERCHDIDDLRRLARRRVPAPVFDYVEGGADEEVAIARNREAYREWSLASRTLVDVSTADTSLELFGRRVPAPLVLAPTGFTRMMHSEGEVAVARAARRAGLPYGLSTVGTTSVEDLAATGHEDLWFQLYILRDRGLTEELIDRAQAARYRVLEVCVDVPVPGQRMRDLRNGLTIPPQLTTRALAQIAAHPGYWTRMLRAPAIEFANVSSSVAERTLTVETIASQFDPTVTWKDLELIRERWSGPLLVKGPVGPEDARRAVESGADGVHLSNHGGRQLDRSPAPLRLVRPVREAIGPDPTILVDSGIRHGSDLALAVALGADAGAVGRVYLYGLMAAGEAGVEHATKILSAQLRRTLQFAGCTDLGDLRDQADSLLVAERGSPRP